MTDYVVQRSCCVTPCEPMCPRSVKVTGSRDRLPNRTQFDVPTDSMPMQLLGTFSRVQLGSLRRNVTRLA